MAGMSRRISQVAGWTLLSRFLGLARDMLLFASLGAGPLNSAFILAFTLPNLFRRLLGEGALTSSSIPVLAETLEKRGPASSFSLLNAILTRLGLVLLGILILSYPLLALVDSVPDLPERWYAGASLARILFPYVLFICLGALVCGMLNVFRCFALAAVNQIWLNLFMIGSIVLGMVALPGEGGDRVLLLCAGVLVGGLLQLVVPAAGLVRQDWKPRIDLKPHPDLGKVLRLFLPGLLGAAIFQVNILVARLLAFSLDDTATGLLYIANRLVELPLGVFAIAVTTVVFPELSRLSSSGSGEAFRHTFNRGLAMIFMVTIPAALGLIVLAGPILGFLFEWGLFGSSDVDATSPVLMAAACGLPFFAWSTLLTRAWYARQSMRVPVILAAVNLVLNLILGLSLMHLIGATGLALANTLAGVVHCLLLQVFFPGKLLGSGRLPDHLVLVSGLAVMVGLAWTLRRVLEGMMADSKLLDLSIVALAIPLSAGAYFTFLWLFRYPALRDWIRKGAGD